MEQVADTAGEQPGTVPLDVLVAAVVAGIAVLPLVRLFVAENGVSGSASLQLAAWAPLAVVGALVLDRRPGSYVGRLCVALALTGLLVMGFSWLGGFAGARWQSLDGALKQLGPWPVGVTLIVLGSLFLDASSRLERRRRFWMSAVIALGVAATLASWQLVETSYAGVVPTAALWVAALTAGVLLLANDLRPVDEPLLDVGIVLVGVVTVAAVGLLVRLGGLLAGLPSPDLSAGFASVITAALAVPASLWVRRSVLARRYGTGILSASDVAAITADLHPAAQPRLLLAKAASMVAAASGSKEVQIVLGEEQPEIPDRCIAEDLVVGGSRVGTLLIKASHAEGPEARQRRVVAQLVPTAALVARAVVLAVEAEHARLDVARERETERARILSDLHDDLGPVLAGMSMRVQALRRARPDAWLDEFSSELATCRADLRRIVSGLTPSALEEVDLTVALDRLVDPYRQAVDGPRVTFSGSLPANLPPVAAAVVYRTVAEGLTNATRHARAGCIAVEVQSSSTAIRARVVDDGVGGPIVPGVGLTSLRRRADELGGQLDVTEHSPGITLSLELPMVLA